MVVFSGAILVFQVMEGRFHPFGLFMPGPVYYRGGSKLRLAALTFDDGPDPRWTPGILQTLRREHVPATFFLVGKNVLAHPELAREERDAGCEIGNHTWDHTDLRTLGSQATAMEIDQAQEAIRKALGFNVKLFRPPYGDLNPFAVREASKRGMKTILWSLSPWHGPSPSPGDLLRYTIRSLHPGAIILLHDGRGSRLQTVQALPSIIAALKARGYQFVTISQMQQHDPGTLPHHHT